jgi:acyl-CoA thioesterase-1
VGGQALADTFRIVGFGDSLMAGYNLGPNEGFPQKLEAALKARGHDVTVANAGVSGDTTAGGISRLDWSVPDGTDLVILELGANDMLRGLPVEAAEKNLDAMMSSLSQRGIGMVLAGMLAAPNLGQDYVQAFNGMYPRLAEKYGVPLIPFFLDGVAANPKLQLDDGLHPNAAGVDRMVEGALPVIEPLVK